MGMSCTTFSSETSMRNGIDPVAMFRRWLAKEPRTKYEVMLWLDSAIALRLITIEMAERLERDVERLKDE